MRQNHHLQNVKVDGVSHEMPFLALQPLKLGACADLLHGRRNTLPRLSRRFVVARATLCACAFYNFVASATFCDVAQWLF